MPIGKRLVSLSGLLRATNVEGVFYTAEYARLEIKITLADGSTDTKTIQGDAVPAVGVILFSDNPLDQRGGRFFEISPAPQPRPPREPQESSDGGRSPE